MMGKTTSMTGAEISSGGSVFAGKIEDGVFILFKNQDGVESPILISDEAARLLQQILNTLNKKELLLSMLGSTSPSDLITLVTGKDKA